MLRLDTQSSEAEKKVKIIIFQVHDSACPSDRRPSSVQSCPGPQHCAVWTTGPWSWCSATCGLGLQTRNVSCKDLQGKPSTLCIEKKPENWRPCHSEKQTDCLEDNSGWNQVIDDIEHTVYLDSEGKEQIHSYKVSHKVEFLESSCNGVKLEAVLTMLCVKLWIL